MAFNPTDIVQELHEEFDELVEFVILDAQEHTADQVERRVFGQILRLGLLLLKAFFQMRCQNYPRDPIVTAEGHELSHIGDRSRTYFSVFGKLKIARPYFYKRGAGGQSPLDEALGLGEDSYSDLLREMHEELSVYIPYEKAITIMSRFLGITLSKRVPQSMVSVDATDVVAYYDQKPPPPPDEEAEILVLQADGKGVPLVIPTASCDKVRLGKGEKRSRKKEAVVTSVYTIAAHPRTPQQVVASLFKQSQTAMENGKNRPSPCHKQVWATLQGKDEALDRLHRQVQRRDGEHLTHHVALCDGDRALQARIGERFGSFTLVLDFIHAVEYLWDVGNCLFGEDDEQRESYVRARALLLLSGQTEAVINEFRRQLHVEELTARQEDVLTKTANYFHRNLPHMAYDAYLQAGWPIASGVIEGACRHLVKDRMELSGMRWHQESAEALLNLRAVAENNDWDAYHAFRRRQRQKRLYGSCDALSTHLEYQQLPLAA